MCTCVSIHRHNRFFLTAATLIVASAFVSACRSTTLEPNTPSSPQVRDERQAPGNAARAPGEPETAFSLPRSVSSIGESGPLRISLEEAVLQALENNRTLRVQRLEPIIAGTFEQLERGVFDPVLFGALSSSRERTERFPDELDEPISDLRETIDAQVGLQQVLPTGTDIEAALTHAVTDSDRVEQTQHRARAGLSVTQSLLQGRGPASNLVSLRRARLETRITEFELRGFAEAVLADVETTYWDFVLARRELEIYEESAALAERQLAATRDRIELGQLAAVELPAADAEVALRRQALINARGRVETLRLRLIRLLNPEPGGEGWERVIEPVEEPSASSIVLDEVADHVRAALRWRPEIHESHLLLESRELEVVQTRNGLLPRLDFFITLGKSGFADSFNESLRTMDGDAYDARVGVRAEVVLGNRQNRARDMRARASREQAKESVQNLAQLVELDVRTAYTEALRAQEQIAAGAATRRLQEEVLRTEMDKFETGLSTTLEVSLVQRDLLEAQIAEVGARIDYRKALVNLYRLEGTLLARRGIGAPGEWSVPVWE